MITRFMTTIKPRHIGKNLRFKLSLSLFFV